MCCSHFNFNLLRLIESVWRRRIAFSDRYYMSLCADQYTKKFKSGVEMFCWKSLACTSEVALGGVLLVLHGSIFAADALAVAEQELPAIVVTGTMPLPGLGLPLRDVAANVQTVKGAEI